MPESEIVFGMNECLPVLDSCSAVDAMSNKEDLLSLNPTLFGSIPNEVGSYLAWTVENLEGSKFNSFVLHGRVCAVLRLLDVRALRERGRVHKHAVHDRPDAAGASAHGVTRARGRGGLQAVDVRGGRRGD